MISLGGLLAFFSAGTTQCVHLRLQFGNGIFDFFDLAFCLNEIGQLFGILLPFCKLYRQFFVLCFFITKACATLSCSFIKLS